MLVTRSLQKWKEEVQFTNTGRMMDDVLGKIYICLDNISVKEAFYMPKKDSSKVTKVNSEVKGIIIVIDFDT
jgi:hypothetical protein